MQQSAASAAGKAISDAQINVDKTRTTNSMIGSGIGIAASAGMQGYNAYNNAGSLSGADITGGASTDPNGYSVAKNGAITWNKNPYTVAGWK
jgi:hypothetical protein